MLFLKNVVGGIPLKKAVAVWKKGLSVLYNQHIGFYTRIAHAGSYVLRITAKSYYRLFLNGKMAAHGPARTTVGYCRIDEIPISSKDALDVAIEVMAYDMPEKYCNDCTMEPGLFSAEIVDNEGKVISATGCHINGNVWKCTELAYRRAVVETMSHCRPILEYADLTPTCFVWMTGNGGLSAPDIVDVRIAYLPRRAPYPTYAPLALPTFAGVSDVVPGDCRIPHAIQIAKVLNAEWYRSIPDANRLLETICGERDAVFTGRYTLMANRRIVIQPGKNPAALAFRREDSEVGFVCFSVDVTEKTIVDVVSADHRNFLGELKGNSYVTRFVLDKGQYELIPFEPRLVRYLKLIIRTEGTVTVSWPHLLTYSYPDDAITGFSCNDNELNRIYQAARKTLRLNTLDILMDCPERERGGWLCDSYFSSAAAWQLWGDLRVEKDFLENFMLTDPDALWKGFFPEVYPGVRGMKGDVGIPNWSFWLLAELHDYALRSGDMPFIEQCRERVSRCVDGMLSLRGDSGLIENLQGAFVDWSLSNHKAAQEPINIPVNCLAVYALEKMGALYHMRAWEKAAADMRERLVCLDTAQEPFSQNGDSADAVALPYGEKAGVPVLRRGSLRTEAGAALELWSGFHAADENYIWDFVYTMGVDPPYRANPNVGKSNVFIGLIVRLHVLARMGRIPQLVKELKALYLPQLRDGSGTLFENHQALSGCHGVNGIAGALLTSTVLGLGEPLESDKSVLIFPNPCALRWAEGSAKTSDGLIFVRWSADEETHRFCLQIQTPENWRYRLRLPFSLHGWTVTVNGKQRNPNDE